MSAMTKKEWMEYLEKTWDAAQKEAWSEPQFECPRCGHCCQALDTEQEPVAWISEGGDVSRSKRYMDEMGFKCTPLYTSPPQRELTCVCGAVWEGEMMVHPPRKREWVGLTDEEIQDLGYLSEKFDASNSI